MIKVSVMYPNTPGTHFNHDYYRDKHMPLVKARLGAPLGHDFCAISLSDNLKPWEIIEKRLRLVSEAGLVIALYNPISKARPWQLGEAFKLLTEILPLLQEIAHTSRHLGRWMRPRRTRKPCSSKHCARCSTGSARAMGRTDTT